MLILLNENLIFAALKKIPEPLPVDPLAEAIRQATGNCKAEAYKM